MASPTAESTMNSTYSRLMPVRARCANDQCRFMKYDDVAATVTEMALLVSGPMPALKCSQLNSAMSSTALNAPTTPNFATSWMRTRNRSYDSWAKDTRRG